MSSNYNFLEGQIPQLIEIDSDFTISYNNGQDSEFKSEFKASDVSYSLQAFVEKLQSDLGLNNMIGLKDDYYISYRRIWLFPQLSDTGDAIKVPISTTSDGGDGFIRYNNTSNQFEGYSSSNWQGLGSY